MQDNDELWEARLEIAMLKDSLKNAQKITAEQILLQGTDENAPHNFGTREEKIAAISRDPKPQWAPPPVRDYATTDRHGIICVDGVLANESLPDASKIHFSPHKVGGFLVSDRLEVPAGWIRNPAKGTPVETIREKYPELYEILTLKKVSHF